MNVILPPITDPEDISGLTPPAWYKCVCCPCHICTGFYSACRKCALDSIKNQYDIFFPAGLFSSGPTCLENDCNIMNGTTWTVTKTAQRGCHYRVFYVLNDEPPPTVGGDIPCGMEDIQLDMEIGTGFGDLRVRLRISEGAGSPTDVTWKEDIPQGVDCDFDDFSVPFLNLSLDGCEVNEGTPIKINRTGP